MLGANPTPTSLPTLAALAVAILASVARVLGEASAAAYWLWVYLAGANPFAADSQSQEQRQQRQQPRKTAAGPTRRHSDFVPMRGDPVYHYEPPAATRVRASRWQAGARCVTGPTMSAPPAASASTSTPAVVRRCGLYNAPGAALVRSPGGSIRKARKAFSCVL